MLERLELVDWKSFGRASELRFSALTLLVGPNASGKSNVLDALRFLQGLALDYSYGEVLRGRYEGQREVWPAIRGHVAEASRLGSSAFEMRSTWRIGGHALTHRLAVSTKGEALADLEELMRDRSPLCSSNAPALGSKSGRSTSGLRVAFKPVGRTNWRTKTIAASRSLLAQVADFPDGIDVSVSMTAAMLRKFLRQSTFLDIQPSRMREYRPENGGVLGASGENISPVLHALKQEAGRLEDVVDWLAEMAAPELAGIDFDQTRLREVMMLVVERGGRRISARSMSDGTLRFLGHVVALLTCPKQALLVVEEPDVGLHPSRIRVLAELLENVTRRRGVQVVATTHSPMLLAHLSEESLGNVVAFGRDPESGLTTSRLLKELPNYESLRDSDRLADLVSTGWLERAL